VVAKQIIMATKNCPTPAALLRAFLEGAKPSLLRHLKHCPSCLSEWTAMAELRVLGQQLPQLIPDETQRNVVKTRLLSKLDEAQSAKLPTKRSGPRRQKSS